MSAVPMEHDVEDGTLITAGGLARLQHELEALREVGRQDLAERFRAARNDGDVAENPALIDLLEEQGQLERRIAVLEAQVASARVAAPARDGIAGLGTSVRVRESATGEVAEYELVGAVETDVGNGRVSLAAPVGRALHGRRKGDVVDVETPRGTIALEVLDVRVERTVAERKAA
jgi:transcription elongation factor GreA